jgi:hypothetical protein
MTTRTLSQDYDSEYPIADLLEHPDDVPTNPGAIFRFGKSGLSGALVVQSSTNYVLVGNLRLRMARAVGLTTLPVFVVDVDDIQAKRILLANAVTDATDTPDLATRLQDFLDTEEAGDPDDISPPADIGSPPPDDGPPID